MILLQPRKVNHRDSVVFLSTSLMFDKAVSLPEMQNRYGVSEVIDSWGEQTKFAKK